MNVLYWNWQNANDKMEYEVVRTKNAATNLAECELKFGIPKLQRYYANKTQGKQDIQDTEMKDVRNSSQHNP